MANPEIMAQYDDDAAVQFILEALSDEMKSKVSEDDVYYFIDLLYEMDEKGIIDEDELVDKMVKEARKDEIEAITAESLIALLDAENAYCKSIGMFD